MPTTPAPAQIITHVDGIGHLLSDRLLAIPDYQRSYSWGEIEVAELWNDLQKAKSAGANEYFLGSIVTTKSVSVGRQLVIDGQQRLATISLLYAAMRDALKERTDERADDIERDFLGRKDMITRQRLPKLTLNADDNDYYLSLIDSKPISATRESHKRLQAAYNFLREKMTDLSRGLDADTWQKPLMELHQFVLENAMVIDVHVPDENRSFVIFETLNDRGLNLNTADLLKNHLFGTAGSSRIEETKRRWSEMIGALGSTDAGDVHDDFLRHYWSSTTGAGRVKALFSEIRDTVTSPSEAVTLATSLSESAPLWAGMFDVDSDFWKKLKPATKERLRVLNSLKVEQCRPLLLAAMRRLPPAEIDILVGCILNWTVRWFVAGGGSAGVTERLYAEAGKKVTDGSITSAGQIVLEFQSRVPSDTDFERAFSVVTVRRGWLARYYLHALEKKQRSGSSSPELTPSQDWEEANLEHVLPKSYNADKWPQFSAESHAAWHLSLGNQVILARDENETIGNEAFAIKAPVLAASSLILTSEVGETADWTADAIRVRQERLGRLAVGTWPITPPTDS
ncbi:DUF262 domain-containing protein [Rathayibacter sp. Leaf296]|uniref:DUF262 domain-containing protein n=1 Tax=Rathayibacter sp. Leaf296 TaxID=1736327 RepID=UPI0009E6D581|nr:DUF262 domain-containing protein [Rathayibacter sp. Leaf296]